jgi:hypothetical protein
VSAAGATTEQVEFVASSVVDIVILDSLGIFILSLVFLFSLLSNSHIKGEIVAVDNLPPGDEIAFVIPFKPELAAKIRSNLEQTDDRCQEQVLTCEWYFCSTILARLLLAAAASIPRAVVVCLTHSLPSSQVEQRH